MKESLDGALARLGPMKYCGTYFPDNNGRSYCTSHNTPLSMDEIEVLYRQQFVRNNSVDGTQFGGAIFQIERTAETQGVLTSYGMAYRDHVGRKAAHFFKFWGTYDPIKEAVDSAMKQKEVRTSVQTLMQKLSEGKVKKDLFAELNKLYVVCEGRKQEILFA